MLDIKFIRENKELVEEAARKKYINFDLQGLFAIDDRRKELLQKIERMRGEQRVFSETMMKSNEVEKVRMIYDLKILKDSLHREEDMFRKVMKEWQEKMLQVPNIPDVTVPEGPTEAENIEIRNWGEKREFDGKPLSHIELMEGLDAIDLTRGAAVSGFRGYFLKNDLATMYLGFFHYISDFFASKGFAPMIAPSLVKRESLLGTGYLPQGEEDLYKTQDGDYLAGTSEVPVMSYFMDEVILKQKLPIKILAFSPCFRREAGSHGKDTKGLIRVHEFYKFEQIIIGDANHAASVSYHEELTQNAEELMQTLKIPYRVMLICGGDLGLGQVKKYDIEAWVPSENKYRETHSASYFHDFQTRRLNIKYKNDEGKAVFAHSLNSTLAAMPRIFVPLFENNQESDGSVRVPEVLVPYVQGKQVFKRKNIS